VVEKNLKVNIKQIEQILEKALALFFISSELHKTFDSNKVYDIILRSLKKIMGVESASIWIRDDKTGRMKKVVSLGKMGKVKKKYSLESTTENIGEIRIHSLHPPKKKLTNQEDKLLTIFADQAAVVIATSRLFAESLESVILVERTLKEAKPIPKKELTKKAAQSLSLMYNQLLRFYLGTKDINKTKLLVQGVCKSLIEFELTPKGIIALHLKTIKQITSKQEFDSPRLAVETVTLLLMVMTNYAVLLRDKL
jgi:hypothetical protein